MKKHSWSFRNAHGREIWRELEKIIASGKSRHTVFSDWLEIILTCFLSMSEKAWGRKENKFEKKYLEIIKPYLEGKKGERAIDYFQNAFGALILEMEENPFHDILGEIYEHQITFGEHGQFFTPMPICDFMAEINGAKDSECVSDCCCGSGKMLLGAAKKNRNLLFRGKDIDARCAKMTTLNLFLNGLRGEVIHGDTISGENQKVWRIEPPLIFEIEDYPNEKIKADKTQKMGQTQRFNFC